METAEERIEIAMDGPEWLVLTTRIRQVSASDLLAWFVDAKLLNQWWGSEAIIEPRIGGRYQVFWPSRGWTMRGTVAFLTHDTLSYSWSWDHEPDQVSRAVMVHVEGTIDGATLTLCHGPYRDGSSADPEAATDRAGHREGWLYFLPRLRAKIAASIGA